MLWALLRPPYPMFLKFEITDSIQSPIGKHFAIADLANMLCSVLASTIFQSQFALTFLPALQTYN